ncbi:hypothetical protein RHMOL_Rhmol02G0071300 [Rhododendron molle]|uniref:Uncharacterized protein n=1 Tax=Rhododendron molle TaxID=49168 RepID=A0ACC0PMU2_RHOML|nr:hypothetical protein RHMOL_Rhmol02G0071300 [Rhododendron molle]
MALARIGRCSFNGVGSEVEGKGRVCVKTPPPIFDCAQDHDIDFKIFRLTSVDVSLLKENAKSGEATGVMRAKITGFNVMTTHVWRCKVLSSCETSRNPYKSSTVLYAVDIRPRLDPPLPKSYTGNAVLTDSHLQGARGAAAVGVGGDGVGRGKEDDGRVREIHDRCGF